MHLTYLLEYCSGVGEEVWHEAFEQFHEAAQVLHEPDRQEVSLHVPLRDRQQIIVVPSVGRDG